MPLNWFDLRWKIENDSHIEPVPYLDNLCSGGNDEHTNTNLIK